MKKVTDCNYFLSDLTSSELDLVHLPEWTFNRKRISSNPNSHPITLTLILTLTLALKLKNLFGKKKWRHFSGKCPDTFRIGYRSISFGIETSSRDIAPPCKSYLANLCINKNKRTQLPIISKM